MMMSLVDDDVIVDRFLNCPQPYETMVLLKKKMLLSGILVRTNYMKKSGKVVL